MLRACFRNDLASSALPAHTWSCPISRSELHSAPRSPTLLLTWRASCALSKASAVLPSTPCACARLVSALTSVGRGRFRSPFEPCPSPTTGAGSRRGEAADSGDSGPADLPRRTADRRTAGPSRVGAPGYQPQDRAPCASGSREAQADVLKTRSLGGRAQEKQTLLRTIGRIPRLNLEVSDGEAGCGGGWAHQN